MHIIWVSHSHHLCKLESMDLTEGDSDVTMTDENKEEYIKEDVTEIYMVTLKERGPLLASSPRAQLKVVPVLIPKERLLVIR